MRIAPLHTEVEREATRAGIDEHGLNRGDQE